MEIKSKQKVVVGMIHVAALPGTPQNKYSISEIIDKALIELKIYIENGVDAVLIENMHDVPYLKKTVGPEIIAAMTAIAVKLRATTKLPLGIQILAGANKAALSVALASSLDFIRAEGFVYGHLADEGFFESDAGELLRFRKQIDATHIKIWTDIKKKHSSHAITSDISIADTAKTAEYFLSDGIIITGSSTGEAVDADDLIEARKSIDLLLIIGSGITNKNITGYWKYADVFIIGSGFKYNNNWRETVDPKAVAELMAQVEILRKN